MIIILIGFALRLYRLGIQSLWYDETVSAYLASQSAPLLIAHTARDIHPPGYYLLLHLWTTITGNTEFALAYFSLLFGTLLIPLTYALARILTNDHIAKWAALLLAVSPFNIWYSQEVRMYTLGAGLGLVAVYCLVKAVMDNWTRYWLGYAISAALGLYTLYYFVFLLIVINVFFLLYSFSKKLLVRRLVTVNLLILIAYLPWLPVAWRQATNPPVPPWRAMPQLWSVLLESWTSLSLGQSVEPVAVWPILVITLGLAGLGLYQLARFRSTLPFSPGLLLLSYTFGSLLLIYLLSFITPLYHVRYVFTYSPAFYILLGAGLFGLATVTKRWMATGVAGLVVAASFYSIYQFHFNPQYHSDDFRAAVDFIQNRWQPGDVILANAGYIYPAFLYYADSLANLQHRRLIPYAPPENEGDPLLLQTGTVNGPPDLGWDDPRSDFYAMPAADSFAALEQISRDYARLWLLRAYDTVTDPDALIRQWLAHHTTPIEDQSFSGTSNIRAQGFILDGGSPPQTDAIPFEDGLALAGWQLSDRVWTAGQTIPVKLWWRSTGPTSPDYKASLKLWTPEGDLAAQGQDIWPGGALYRATNWPVGEAVYQPMSLAIPPDLAPGQYWLNVELYHPETIQPLHRLGSDEAAVTLGSIHIQ